MYQHRRQSLRGENHTPAAWLGSWLAACLTFDLLYPAGTEGLGMHLAVFAPAQGFPRGQTAAVHNPKPRSQMFHHGCMQSLVARHYLSAAHLTAAAGSHHVSLLRTSQTLTTLHLS